MNVGRTIFAQTMDFVPWTSFGRIVDRYSGNAGVRRMSCAEQFRVMAFARARPEQHGLCVGLDDNRSVSELIRVGVISFDQSSRILS
jgi:hypothetical protein